MIRGTIRAAAGATALAVAAGLVSVTVAHADPISTARDRAAALSRQVTTLTDRAEAASQRYDAVEARLAASTTSVLQADRRLAVAHAAAVKVQRRLDGRVQALYESAGSFGMFPAMLSGTAAQAVQSDQLSASVLADDTVQANRDRMITTQARQAAGVRQVSARQTVRLQRRAAAQQDAVNRLLARQQQALAQATADVRRMVAQQQRQQQEAAAAAFRSAVVSAGGQISGSMTPPDSIAAAAIAAARTRLGVPYVWGATGPDSFDCSGLTQWSYAHAGIALPRVAADQWFSGPHPSLSQLEPGDLLFWAFDPNDPATIHHVAIYIGGGMMIAAPHTGTDVQVEPVYYDGLFGATRPWASSAG